MHLLKLSGETKEYIYTLTEDAAPAGFEIAESVQFKVDSRQTKMFACSSAKMPMPNGCAPTNA